MSKERILLTSELVTENKINVENEHTCYCRIERMIFPDINELEKEIKQIRKQLKEMNISMYKTDTLKLLKEQRKEYNEMVNDYNNSFDQLVNEWKVKLDNGLYVGTCNDDHLNNIIYPLKWKLEKFNYRGTLLSKIRDIQKNVNEIKQDLKDNECTLIKVAI